MQYATVCRSDGPAIPSWSSHPAVSSKSWPGVRIVTHTRRAGEPGHASRISRGSSAATRSSRVRSPASVCSSVVRRRVGPGRSVWITIPA